MNLPDLFHAVNLAGIRLANVAGRIQARGAAGAITPEIAAAVTEHKQTLLSLLPESDPAKATKLTNDSGIEADARAERMAIIAEANGMTTPDQLAEAVLGWDRVAVFPRIDAKQEWLLELAVVYLRWANCTTPEVRDRLQALLDRRPADSSGCNVMVTHIREVENELREAGKLPGYHWPDDRPPTIDIDLDLWNEDEPPKVSDK